jgi:hypothetical protein
MPAAAQQPAATYYIAPEGSDENSGVSAASPWQTFDHAVSRLRPGDTLILLDGVYEPATTGRLYVNGENGALSGTKTAPITIKAQNERRAWIKSDGLDAAVLLRNVNWWVLDGLRASNTDNPDAQRGGEGIKLVDTRHMIIRRCLAHHNNRYRNSQMIGIVASRDVLVEETEIYNFHRNGFSAYRSEDVTFRRCYANSRGHADLPDGRGSHKISDDGGDRAFVGYHASNFLVENSISENKTEGFGGISGFETPSGEPSGERFRFLGNISLNDNMTGAMQSREMNENSRPVRDVHFEHFVMIGSIRAQFVSRAVRDLTMENVTVWNGMGSAFQGSFDRQDLGRTAWPACKEIGGCTVRLRNWLVAKNRGEALGSVPENGAALDFRAEHSNFWEIEEVGLSETPDDDSGQLRKIRSTAPTAMGLDQGECIVFVPDHSNMHGEGQDGADIGANILYRYENGQLTDEPLWNPETGAFPHGAVIEGMNDAAGNSAFDVHERLNVNTNGCRLPYGSAAADEG